MVYDEKGGYTDSSRELSDALHSLVKELIIKSMNEKGMSIEEVMYITSNEIEAICLRNQFKLRQIKREKEKEAYSQ